MKNQLSSGIEASFYELVSSSFDRWRRYSPKTRSGSFGLPMYISPGLLCVS